MITGNSDYDKYVEEMRNSEEFKAHMKEMQESKRPNMVAGKKLYAGQLNNISACYEITKHIEEDQKYC